MHSFFIVALRISSAPFGRSALASVILRYQALSRKSQRDRILRPLSAFRFRFDNSVKLRLASFRSRWELHSISFVPLPLVARLTKWRTPLSLFPLSPKPPTLFFLFPRPIFSPLALGRKNNGR